MHLIRISVCLLSVFFISTSVLAGKGDIDMDGYVNLADALIALQTASDTDTAVQFNVGESDVNQDGNIGIAEAIYALQVVADLRAGEEFEHIFDVGPGQEYADPSEMPWESLQPGTLVRIHYREQPYAHKWVIDASATENAPVVVRGIPEGSLLPVITGINAATRQQLSYWNEDRSVIKIGGSNHNSTETSHITVENLDIYGGRPPYTFTNDGGGSGSYINNAAAVHIEEGSNITIRNCILRDSGNGLFVTSLASEVLVEGNHIYDNGIEGSYYEHNSYTSAMGITFQFNHYGPLRSGCIGNNLKDRSAGTVFAITGLRPEAEHSIWSTAVQANSFRIPHTERPWFTATFSPKQISTQMARWFITAGIPGLRQTIGKEPCGFSTTR